MRRFLTLSILAVLIALRLASGADAATLDGVTLPARYAVNGQTLVLNGIGVRTVTLFRIRIYVAGLYLLRPSRDAAQILASTGPKVLLLQFIRNGTKAQVDRQYRQSEANNCGGGACSLAERADFDRLVAAEPAVRRGDTSKFIFTDNGVKVFANSHQIADFADIDFARRLLAGFIGPHPPSASLRDELLHS